MMDQTPPIPAIPYETPGDAPANVVVLMRLGILLLAAVAVQFLFYGFGVLLVYLLEERSMTGFGVVFFVVIAVTVAAGLILCAYLWKRVPDAAIRLFGRTALPSLPSADGSALLGVGLVVLGGYEIVEAVYSASEILVPIVVRHWYPISFSNRSLVELLPSGVRAAVGLWLILGNERALELIRRHSGRYRDQPSSEADRPPIVNQTHQTNGS
jgi:hypothetical protein